MKKQKYLSDMEKEKRQKMKFFKLLNDGVFWIKLNNISNYYRLKKLREYRTKLLLPKTNFLKKFIIEYKLIEKDERENTEILLDLLSLCED